MKALVAIALLLAVARADLYADFIDWTVEYGKTYRDTFEHARRFQNYKNNAALVAHYNRQGRGVFGLGPFADLSQEEFEETYLRPIPKEALPNARTTNYITFNTNRAFPESKNWVDEGVVNEIKDQGGCGSCWAFSAASNMESVTRLTTGVLPRLSEQQLVDCDHECMIFPGTSSRSCDAGCNGGLMPNAFSYAMKNGMTTEEEYPYTGRDGTCKAPREAKYHFSRWDWVGKPTPTGATDEEMIAGLNELGPLAVAVEASRWSSYKGGIFTTACSSTSMNHAVVLVGYGTEGRQDYWIVRNSWGKSWGEAGYIRLPRHENKCGINMFVCTIFV